MDPSSADQLISSMLRWNAWSQTKPLRNPCGSFHFAKLPTPGSPGLPSTCSSNHATYDDKRLAPSDLTRKILKELLFQSLHMSPLTCQLLHNFQAQGFLPLDKKKKISLRIPPSYMSIGRCSRVNFSRAATRARGKTRRCTAACSHKV